MLRLRQRLGGTGTGTDVAALMLYSMTKLVVSVAVLQLVDQGVLSLDDPAIVDKHAPELAAMPVLTGFDDADKPILTPRTEALTLRRLLTHTSGCSYDFTNAAVAKYQVLQGVTPRWPVAVEDNVRPLSFQPGSAWQYGVGIDWAGLIVERATGKNLEEYFKANIFSPLGIEDITFYPTPQVVERLQTACAPNADDDTVYTHVPSTRPMTSETVGLLSGGAGLFGTAKSYLRFLQGILASSPAATASGTATTTAPKLLSPTGFATLFTNSLPPRSPESKDVYAGLAAQLNRMFYVDTEHVANDAQYIEHSVGLVLNTRDSRHGRKAGSGCWDGAAKTHYWLDPTTGIAVSCWERARLQMGGGDEVMVAPATATVHSSHRLAVSRLMVFSTKRFADTLPGYLLHPAPGLQPRQAQPLRQDVQCV